MEIIKILIGLLLLSIFAYFSWLLYKAEPNRDPVNFTLKEYLLIFFVFFFCPSVGMTIILNSIGLL